MTHGRRARPQSERLRRAAPYAAVLAAAIWLYTVAGHFQFARDPGRIGPDAWPKLVLVLMAGCALWGLGTALGSRRQEGAPAAEIAEDALITPPEIHPWRVWVGIGLTFLYLLALPRLGFLLATALYAMVLIRLGQYRNWRRTIVIGVALALGFFFVFMRIVYVALPIGEGPFARLSLAVMAAMGVH